MNIWVVALKDLRRVFRSVFALIMMFGAPLLIAGLLYFAFGGMAGGGDAFTLAPTRLMIANLDQGGSSGSPFKAGELLISFLQNEDISAISWKSAALPMKPAPVPPSIPSRRMLP